MAGAREIQSLQGFDINESDLSEMSIHERDSMERQERMATEQQERRREVHGGAVRNSQDRSVRSAALSPALTDHQDNRRYNQSGPVINNYNDDTYLTWRFSRESLTLMPSTLRRDLVEARVQEEDRSQQDLYNLQEEEFYRGLSPAFYRSLNTRRDRRRFRSSNNFPDNNNREGAVI